MTETAPKKGTPSVPLRSRPKRTKADLSEREQAAVVAHCNRHDDWTAERLSDFLWVDIDLVRQARS